MSEETNTSANTNADFGNWDDDFKGNRSGNKQQIKWMRFDKEGDYSIRLIGKHVKFLKHWKPFSKRVISHISYEGKDPAWNAGFKPIETFAIHIIDRSDGQVKILEKPKSFFKKFGDYKRINGVNPASKEAPDFVVTVTFQNGNPKRPKYDINAKTKMAPITEEEMKLLNDNKVDLEKLYKSTPLDKIVEYWSGLPEEAKVPPEKDSDRKEDTKVEVKKEEKVVEPPKDSSLDNSPSDKDDLFESEAEEDNDSQF